MNKTFFRRIDLKTVHYTVLEDHFKRRIPKGLSEKFVNLLELIVRSDSREKKELFNFIKECSPFT